MSAGRSEDIGRGAGDLRAGEEREDAIPSRSTDPV
jgi:hypothetical protein